ncbi:hypothetical protein EF879_09615 [Micromonospora sp. HM5-17]|nr:hypothetical protein EF879_09615 [Micromonospora sp. HM5-17]
MALARPDSVRYIEDSAFDSVLSVTRIEAQRLSGSDCSRRLPLGRDLGEDGVASIEELKATVRDGTQAVESGLQILEGAAAEVAETSALAAQTLHNSQHPEIVKALASLAAAEREAKLTLRRFAAAKERADTYLARLG